MKEYEVVWREIRNGKFVIKRKAFESADKRFNFMLRLEKNPAYDCLIAFRDPVSEPLIVMY